MFQKEKSLYNSILGNLGRYYQLKLIYKTMEEEKVEGIVGGTEEATPEPTPEATPEATPEDSESEVAEDKLEEQSTE